jgi:hypothetical protein
MCHDRCQLENVYDPDDDDMAWCIPCQAWQHVRCCVKAPEKDLADLIKAFDQGYILEFGLEQIKDQDFLFLFKMPIRRFSEESSNPLSIEKLQGSAHVWFGRGDLIVDENWLKTMLDGMNGWEDENKARAVLEKFKARETEYNWVICGKCNCQLI